MAQNLGVLGVHLGAHRRMGRAVLAAHVAVLGSICFVPVKSAHGAGFALREYSLSAEGSAFAGAAALSDEPGGLSYNPATGSGVGDWDMSMTIGFIDPDTTGSFSLATTSFGGPTGGQTEVREIMDALEPGMQLRYRLGEQW